MAFFAWAYFSFKYQCDKYNLVFVYFKKFESGGKMRNIVKKFMLFNVFLYLFTMVCFFGYKWPDQPFYWLGVFLTICWAGLYFYIQKNKDDEAVASKLRKMGIIDGSIQSFNDDMSE